MAIRGWHIHLIPALGRQTWQASVSSKPTRAPEWDPVQNQMSSLPPPWGSTSRGVITTLCFICFVLFGRVFFEGVLVCSLCLLSPSLWASSENSFCRSLPSSAWVLPLPGTTQKFYCVFGKAYMDIAWQSRKPVQPSLGLLSSLMWLLAAAAVIFLPTCPTEFIRETIDILWDGQLLKYPTSQLVPTWTASHLITGMQYLPQTTSKKDDLFGPTVSESLAHSHLAPRSGLQWGGTHPIRNRWERPFSSQWPGNRSAHVMAESNQDGVVIASSQDKI